MKLQNVKSNEVILKNIQGEKITSNNNSYDDSHLLGIILETIKK